MPVTGACAEIVYLGSYNEADYDRPITDEELSAALLENTRVVDIDEFVDVDFRGDDAFSV
jgi:non-homologous end joining protein Ku